ncbi:Speedy protein C, partial [Frankliniella fusca]
PRPSRFRGSALGLRFNAFLRFYAFAYALAYRSLSEYSIAQLTFKTYLTVSDRYLDKLFLVYTLVYTPSCTTSVMRIEVRTNLDTFLSLCIVNYHKVNACSLMSLRIGA